MVSSAFLGSLSARGGDDAPGKTAPLDTWGASLDVMSMINARGAGPSPGLRGPHALSSMWMGVPPVHQIRDIGQLF